MKKALLVNSSFYPKFGGVENSLRSIASELTSKGWEVDVLTSNCKELDSEEILFGARVLRYDASHPLSYVYSFFKLARKVNFDKYSLILCRHHTLTVLLKVAGAKNIHYVVPGVHYYQNLYNLSIRKPLSILNFGFNVTMQLLSFAVSNLYVFSKTMEKQVRVFSSSKKEIKYLRPGVDPERFSSLSTPAVIELRNNHGLPLNKKIVLGLGRFVEIKNFHTLVQAFNYLPEDYFLLLVGDGSDRRKLELLVSEYNLSQKVKIFDPTDKPEDFYKLADVFCMPSTYEPFGQVLLEATFSGLPVIALNGNLCANVDTASYEIYEHYKSLATLVDNNTPEGFARAIKSIDKKQLLTKELEDFKNSFSWMSLINKVLRSYKGNPAKNNGCQT